MLTFFVTSSLALKCTFFIYLFHCLYCIIIIPSYIVPANRKSLTCIQFNNNLNNNDEKHGNSKNNQILK